jgi:hypothetical protein
MHNGNNAIVTRSTIAIVTTVKRPAHQWQHLHHDEGNNASLTTSDKGKDACARTHKQTYHMFVFACTPANISYVQACELACKPCEPLLWPSAQQISLLPHLPPCFATFVCRNCSQLFVPRQESANNKYVGATITSCWYFVYSIFWLDWFFKQNRFVLTFPTGKGRSGQRHFYQLQSNAEQLCTLLDASGWRWPHLKKGKEPHWQFWSGYKPYLVFSETFLYFGLCLTRISFFWQEMSI